MDAKTIIGLSIANVREVVETRPTKKILSVISRELQVQQQVYPELEIDTFENLMYVYGRVK